MFYKCIPEYINVQMILKCNVLKAKYEAHEAHAWERLSLCVDFIRLFYLFINKRAERAEDVSKYVPPP